MHKALSSALILTALLSLSACKSAATQMEELLGVVKDENATSCIEMSFHGNGTFSSASITLKRIEWPTGFDASTLSVDGLAQAHEIVCP